MQERRASWTAASQSSSIATDALALPLGARRDLVLSLLWSLPRDDIISLNDDLSRLLQKDIVGNLPPELAVIILSKLDLSDILKCRLVCRSWTRLCEEQGLWVSLCAASVPPVKPRQATWADVALHQQLLHIPRSTLISEEDEAAFESGLDDLTFNGADGGLDVIGGQGGLGGGGGVDPYVMSGGIRGLVWERSGSGLPTHSMSHSSGRPNSRSSPRQKRHRPNDWQVGRRLTPFTSVASHLALPTSMPQVSYKHLYIVSEILTRRVLECRVGLAPTSDRHVKPHQLKPITIDAISSIEAGGLPGHSETIYSLQLISRQMNIVLKAMKPQQETAGGEILEEDVTTSPRPGSTRHTSHSRNSSSAPITGRDWLLSASRDHTLRLWQLACAKPRVVKIFREGHTGSILSLCTTSVAMIESSADRSPSRSKRRHRETAQTRLLAISGGSDGRLCMWDVEHGDGKPARVVQAHDDSILCVRADADRIVSASKDRTIKVFNVHTLQAELVIDCNIQEGLHRGAINAVCLTKDYILSASGDRTLRVWSVHSGAPLACIDPGTRGIASMDFSPPPPSSHPALKGIIAIGSSDASIKVYHLISHVPGVDIVDALDIVPPLRDLTLRDMLHQHEDESELGSDLESTVADDSFELDEDAIPVGLEANHELRLELAARPSGPEPSLCTRCYNRGHTDLVRSVFLGEKVILSASYDSTVKVWDRSTGRLLSNLTGVHSGRIFSVVGDRMRIISSGLDARISIWDFTEGLDTAFVEP